MGEEVLPGQDTQASLAERLARYLREMGLEAAVQPTVRETRTRIPLGPVERRMRQARERMAQAQREQRRSRSYYEPGAAGVRRTATEAERVQRDLDDWANQATRLRVSQEASAPTTATVTFAPTPAQLNAYDSTTYTTAPEMSHQWVVFETVDNEGNVTSYARGEGSTTESTE